MSAARVWDALPEDFDVLRDPRGVVAVRRDFRAAIEHAGLGLTNAARLAASDLSGRKPLYEIRTSAGTLLVRRFSHGGLLRTLTGRRFRDPERPFVELLVSRALQQAGVRTPEVVAARAWRAPVFGWELDLVTRRVDDTIDLGHVLGGMRRGEFDRARAHVLAAALGLCVAKLHAHGFLHADLTLNNVLVNRAALRADEPVLWVLDLDRTRRETALTDEDRRSNLRRLLRFVERREARDGRILTRTDYARFFKGYDTSGARWKDDWRAIAADHARAGVWHRVGWMLERAFGSGRDPRERTRS